jgi:hypothetical protein
MSKKIPIERFQQLAGIKPLYEQLGPRMSNPRPTGPSNDTDYKVVNADTGKTIDFGLDKAKALEIAALAIEDNINAEVVKMKNVDDVGNLQGDDEDLRLEPEDSEYVDEIELEDLDFETLKVAFPKFYQNEKFTRTQPNGEEGPYYSDSISFPNLDDSSMEIGDSSALEDWKDKVLRRFGNVEIVFNDEAKNHFDRVFVSDDAFNDARDGFIRGKMSGLNR